jgi:uncharacterized protein YbjT (DUF2867 family)
VNIIVFGATGGTGRHVVRQALEEGFEVTAFVRNPARLDMSHGKLRVVRGDALHPDEVSAAIAGHDAVVSCLGSSQGLKPSTELQEMTRNIVNGMLEHGVERIVYTASAGIDREIPGLGGKLIMYLLRHTLADHRAAVELIRQRGLNYTIVRPLGLTNRELTGRYREAAEGVPPKSMSIPRADVAHFILKALQDPRYHRTSIAVAT